jgi:hypothetical protein
MGPHHAPAMLLLLPLRRTRLMRQAHKFQRDGPNGIRFHTPLAAPPRGAKWPPDPGHATGDAAGGPDNAGKRRRGRRAQ